jgi:hypothetical protein
VCGRVGEICYPSCARGVCWNAGGGGRAAQLIDRMPIGDCRFCAGDRSDLR